MTVELAEVRDFLAKHAPFDALPAEVLDRLPRHCTIRYARRGTTILDAGTRGDGLYVVRSGAVDVLDDSGGLIERLGAGGAFGMSTLLEHRVTRYRSVATEDTLLLVLEAAEFESLLEGHPAFATFYAATHHDRLARAIHNLQQAVTGSTVLSTSVRELATRAPVTTTADASIAAAAAVMSESGVSSLLVVDGDGRLDGILTDRDLRNRVLAAGVDPGEPVRTVMTSDPTTLRSDAMAFEALLEMASRNIHHLPLVDGHGNAVGLVTTTDLVRLENANPVYLAADLARQATLEGVVEECRRIPVVLGQLLDRDVSAADVSRVLTAVGDAARRRVVSLVEAEVAAAQGPPPVPYAWVVLGSVAREEEALSADQDHALIVAEEGHDEWFAALAEGVVAALEECGWPRCPGAMMATTPSWRATPAQWHERFARWSREPESEAVLHVAVFHDMRHLAGDPRLTEEVRRSAASAVSPRLLGHLGSQALGMRPPLGFFRNFVLESEGEHRDTLDLKRGIAAVVQAARYYSLRAGSPALSTLSRLQAAQEAGLLDADRVGELRDAWELMSYRRLHHQVAQHRAGEEPDNHVAPAQLTDRQRRNLKDAFGIVRSAQHQLAERLGPGY